VRSADRWPRGAVPTRRPRRQRNTTSRARRQQPPCALPCVPSLRVCAASARCSVVVSSWPSLARVSISYPAAFSPNPQEITVRRLARRRLRRLARGASPRARPVAVHRHPRRIPRPRNTGAAPATRPHSLARLVALMLSRPLGPRYLPLFADKNSVRHGGATYVRRANRAAGADSPRPRPSARICSAADPRRSLSACTRAQAAHPD
jgi:hypothetical protein